MLAEIQQRVSRASGFQMAYALFRITLGVNIFCHGFMRIIIDTGVWVDSQVALFSPPLAAWESFLPTSMITVFLYVLPFFEVVLGIFLALGFFTYQSSIAGALMMLVLIFGNTTRHAWGTVGNNMHYTLYFCILVAAHPYDWFALDNRQSS